MFTKRIINRLRKLGFVKTHHDSDILVFERHIDLPLEEYSYVHVVTIKWDKGIQYWMLSSYNRELKDNIGFGNSNVPLTSKEVREFGKLMKKIKKAVKENNYEH